MAEQEAFYQNQKVINKIYKPNTAAYLMLLNDKYKYWSTHSENFQKITGHKFNGNFYVSRTTIEKEINISRSTQIRIEQELAKDGILIVTKMKHKPNWFTLNHDKIEEKIDTYYEDQKSVLPVFDYPFDDEDEIDSTPTERSTPSADNDVGTPAKMTQVPTTNRTVNNNKESKIKNKNKVSNRTDIFNETDANYLENKNSCINKKEPAQQPPSANAHSGIDAEIYEIINKYNSVMGLKEAKGDYQAVRNNIDDFRKLEKYFTPIGLKYAWKNFADKGARDKLTKPHISTIVSFKLLDTFVKRCNEIYAYEADYLDTRLDRAFRFYQQTLNKIKPDEFSIDSAGNLSLSEFIPNFNNKIHREKRLEVYKQYLEPILLQNDDKHDMIIAEV